MKTKKELRKEILELRDNLTENQRKEKSEEITNKISTHSSFQAADKILLFASYKSEVDTSLIMNKALAMGKQVYLPKVEYDECTGREEMEFYQIFSEADLEEGYKGIREPKAKPANRFVMPADEKVLMILPGAVFDLDGNRIGYGGGFYDRYIKRLDGEAFKAALAFHCQIVEPESIPCEPYDAQINAIVSEEGLYICK